MDDWIFLTVRMPAPFHWYTFCILLWSHLQPMYFWGHARLNFLFDLIVTVWMCFEYKIIRPCWRDSMLILKYLFIFINVFYSIGALSLIHFILSHIPLFFHSAFCNLILLVVWALFVQDFVPFTFFKNCSSWLLYKHVPCHNRFLKSV